MLLNHMQLLGILFAFYILFPQISCEIIKESTVDNIAGHVQEYMFTF